MIIFKTKNVDEIEITNSFGTVEEIRENWFDENGTTLPGSEDELISCSINGVDLYLSPNMNYDCPIFLDLLVLLGIDKY